MLPFKDQKSANAVRRQLGDLSRKINVDISPVYTSRINIKIKDEIRVREDKLPLVNQQGVVYHFQCDLCDAGYVGYTCRRHLYQRIEEHKGSAIGNHLREQHNMAPNDIGRSFKILKKCQNELDCLIFEMLFYQRTKTNTKQTVRFHPRETIYFDQFLTSLIILLFHCFMSYFNFYKYLSLTYFITF